jgi:hypothetical protein
MGESNLNRLAQTTHAAVPCPQCGWYQEYMVPLARRKGIHWTQIVGSVLLAIALAAFPLDPTMVIAGTGIFAGLGLLFTGFYFRLRADPNSGQAQTRIKFARAHALWGEPLAKLLKEQPMYGP